MQLDGIWDSPDVEHAARQVDVVYVEAPESIYSLQVRVVRYVYLELMNRRTRGFRLFAVPFHALRPLSLGTRSAVCVIKRCFCQKRALALCVGSGRTRYNICKSTNEKHHD